jgi:hypothetical protein
MTTSTTEVIACIIILLRLFSLHIRTSMLYPTVHMLEVAGPGGSLSMLLFATSNWQMQRGDGSSTAQTVAAGTKATPVLLVYCRYCWTRQWHAKYGLHMAMDVKFVIFIILFRP